MHMQFFFFFLKKYQTLPHLLLFGQTSNMALNAQFEATQTNRLQFLLVPLDPQKIAHFNLLNEFVCTNCTSMGHI